MNLSKFKYAYSRDGIVGFINIFLSKLGFKIRLKNGIQKRIDWITKIVVRETDNIVLSGYYKGIRFDENKWRENDLASKLLGVYESCVQDKIYLVQKNEAERKKIIINLGSADGFHLIGLLKNDFFEEAVIFEKDLNLLNNLKKNVEINSIQKKIQYFNEADENFIKTKLTNLSFKDCFFLIDIEGDEFKILTKENLKLVKNSKMIIEFHPKSKNENEKFLNNLKEFFDLEIIYKKLNNLENIKFLHEFSDIDRMLACNEDRTFLQHWIFCNPKK